MAPTVLRDGQFRLFFFSREESRVRVHISHPFSILLEKQNFG